MNTRIKMVRTDAAKNQDEFASSIGLTKNFVSLLETGGRTPSDRTVSDICRVYNVSESWLRTGEGEMHPPVDRAVEIAQIVNAALDTTPEEARASLAARLAALSDAEVVILAQVLRRMFPD